MSTLFDEAKIGGLGLANRIVLSPMTRNRADRDGVPTDLMATYYAQRAGAGLIVTEGTQPSAIGQGYVTTPGLHTDEQVAGWRKVTDAVHAEGGRIFIQIMHTGRIGHSSLHDGELQVAPSPVLAEGQTFTYEGLVDNETPRELTTAEVEQTVAEYVQAARNAIRAGADGVELHGANGYLIHQFLASGSNQRADKYGGSVANRIRFAVEVATEVAKAIGPERVGLRISPANTFNGISETETEELYPALLREIAPLGLAYLHIVESAGREFTRTLRAQWPGVVILSPNNDGAPTGKEHGEQAIADGACDLVAFGRQFLANPDLPARFRAGADLNEADPATFYGGDHRGYTDYPALTA
ncbi:MULTISPECIES: alkene reductase [unclassified Crossiella]|uniref:alkene reductase n=1 Tax=unclassified Crossiella TaxID=2620835 RepID=UPI001FFF6DA0|nr:MULTISPECIES: alkene reductase [unclassified Crossiella]MCK2242560.1 alkene reductase [Crossiella sp. S99.2]MCK2254410.1 alkene reductase [Crossiella sp. S99.1]